MGLMWHFIRAKIKIKIKPAKKRWSCLTQKVCARVLQILLKKIEPTTCKGHY